MRVLRDLVGEILGQRYHLISRIAGGGMGDVYRGHDMLLDRAVAVKVLQPTLATDPELVERFKQEARAAARLTHPNVVGVYDWGSEDDRTYYMVMEYVPGTDLRDVLVSRGALPPSQAVAVVAAVCDALAAAHQTGLVHRDVKPENVLIARSGTVKVADFGIAAVADADRTAPGGVISGTLRYLSPEQASGHDATHASDIWSAGAILGELVTGMPPSMGSGGDLMRTRPVETPRRPSEVDARLPAALDGVVTKACALDPEHRYTTAAEMAGALRRLQDELSPGDHLESLVSDVTGEIRLPDSEPTVYERRARRRPRAWRRVALVLIGLLMAFGATRAAAAIFGPQDIEVPVLVGLTLEGARVEAEDTGFDVAVAGRQRDLDAPAGEVLSQDPAIGLLREGSTIELVVSSGPPEISVPSVVGMDLQAATVRLAASQLEIGKVTHRFDAMAEGTVIRQSVADEERPWGSAINVVVSKGPKSIAIPNVTGMSVKDAKATLKETGFTVTVVDVYSNDVRAGNVAHTTPAAGALAPEGSEVEIGRSVGPRYKKVKVPDVRNMSVSAARSQLERLGLRVLVQEVGEPCGGGGTVADTDPLPGTVVRENDRIALFVVC